MKKINLPLLVLSLLFTLLYQNAQSQTTLNDGLMIHYPFNGDANDISGNEKHGTLYNVALTNDRNGNPNSAYYFSGEYDKNETSSHITFPTENLINENYTYAMWVKFLKIPGNNVSAILISLGNYGADQAMSICNNCLGGEGWGMISYPTLSYTSHPLPLENTWYHIVGVRYDQGIRMYINGKYVGGVGTKEVPEYTLPAVGILGNRFNFNGPFTGVMDDVRIYNRALNGKEVDELFNIQGSIITNTKSISSLSTVTIFPSPSNGKFNIGSKTENETFTEIEIYDNKGLSVYKEYNNLGIHTQLDLSHLFHGLYFIKLKTNNNIYNEKIIIQ